MKFFKGLNLEEWTMYEVTVRYTQCNPPHKAILFTGYEDGAYAEIFDNSYEGIRHLSEVYSIRIDKKIGPLNRSFVADTNIKWDYNTGG